MRNSWIFSSLTALSVSLLVAACGPSGSDPDGGAGGGDGGNGECTAGQNQCFGQIFQTCTAGGDWEETLTCTPPELCNVDLGCVQCTPGVNYCVGDDVYGCDANGQQTGVVEMCGMGTQCSNGQCVDPCADAEANRSYIGCEYMAVDLDNATEILGPVILLDCAFSYGAGVLTSTEVCWNGSTAAGQCDPDNTCPNGFTCQTQSMCVLDAQRSPFAIVVSNPNNGTATVRIENGAGTMQSVTVAAGAVQEIFPQMIGFPDASVDRSGIQQKAYKVTSDLPIVAYQFNPLDNVDVFSNDGSLLIPTSTYDTTYYGMSYPTLTRRPQGTNDYNSYVSVVAHEAVRVRVTPTANVRANGSFAAITAGTPTEFDLAAFDVLHLEAEGGPNAGHDGSPDLTGTLVEAVNGTDTFGVFGGHEAIVIPNNPNDCCADHVEEMMFPTSTWGVDFALAKSQSRGMNEPDMLRVIAQADGTQVTFNPSAQGTCPTLNAGEWCEVMISGDTEVSGGDKPILIGHYLLSVIALMNGTGDPAMALAVPSEQFRASYTFLVPSAYAMQYVSIVSPTGNAVLLDGNDVSGQMTQFGSNSFAAGRFTTAPGQHKVDCPGGGCGIEVYGYDDAVSYLFAGGLDLEQIVID
jgi:hypothetical protein